MKDVPLFSDFLSFSNDDIAPNVPETLIYSVSGTRRSAALAGISPNGEEYAVWSRKEMLKCVQILFDHGVKNVLMPILTPSQFNESTRNYSEHLWRWIDWGLASEGAIDEFNRRGWYVNIPFADFMPELAFAKKRLAQLPSEDRPRLWVFVIPSHNAMMEWMLKMVQANPSMSDSEDVIRLLYGEDIVPASMYLDFGKPVVSPDLVPPFLAGVMHCYWSQKPGYSLTDGLFRSVLYDYLYLRKTWAKDKSNRPSQILDHADIWQSDRILGLGQELGPYWYPVS